MVDIDLILVGPWSWYKKVSSSTPFCSPFCVFFLTSIKYMELNFCLFISHIQFFITNFAANDIYFQLTLTFSNSKKEAQTKSDKIEKVIKLKCSIWNLIFHTQIRHFSYTKHTWKNIILLALKKAFCEKRKRRLEKGKQV